jgi:hypothetical protein
MHDDNATPPTTFCYDFHRPHGRRAIVFIVAVGAAIGVPPKPTGGWQGHADAKAPERPFRRWP